MKEKVLGLYRHRFVRSVATLQSGSIVLNFIQAAAGIFLVRMLGPEKFGTFTLAISMASLASALVGIGVQDAIGSLMGEAYARRDRGQIHDVAAFLLKILLCIGGVVLVVSVFLPAIAGWAYGSEQIGRLASMVLVAALLSSSFFSLAVLGFQLLGKISAMTGLMITDQLARFGLSVLFVFMGWGVVGATGGHLAGAVLVSLVSVVVLRKIQQKEPLFPTFSDLLGHIRHVSIFLHLKFSLWTTADRNIAMLFGILPVLLAGLFLPPEEVTFFKLALSYATLALSLLGPISVLLNVQFPKTRIDNPADLRRVFIKVSGYSLTLSAALTAVALGVAPWAFRILYGEALLESVKYAYSLALYAGLFGIGVGLGPMWRALNLVKVSIVINVITLALGVPLGLWLISIYGTWGAVAAVTIWYTASHLVSFIYLYNKLKT